MQGPLPLFFPLGSIGHSLLPQLVDFLSGARGSIWTRLAVFRGKPRAGRRPRPGSSETSHASRSERHGVLGLMGQGDIFPLARKKTSARLGREEATVLNMDQVGPNGGKGARYLLWPSWYRQSIACSDGCHLIGQQTED